jgi:hypothetical protein
LHKTDNLPWTHEELNPIKTIEIREVTPLLSIMGADITLQNGAKFTIDFNNIDGRRSC